MEDVRDDRFGAESPPRLRSIEEISSGELEADRKQVVVSDGDDVELNALLSAHPALTP